MDLYYFFGRFFMVELSSEVGQPGTGNVDQVFDFKKNEKKVKNKPFLLLLYPADQGRLKVSQYSKDA